MDLVVLHDCFAQNELIDNCLQLFGGYGYMLEFPIAQVYADARVQRIYGGAAAPPSQGDVTVAATR